MTRRTPARWARPDVAVASSAACRDRRSRTSSPAARPAPLLRPSRSTRPSARVTALKTGVLTTLRIDDSQGTGLLRCDPDYSNGQAFDGVPERLQAVVRREPVHERAVVEHADTECPSTGQWFNYGAMPSPFCTNSSTNPWRCVPTARAARRGRSATGWRSQPTTAATSTTTRARQHLVPLRRQLRRQAGQRRTAGVQTAAGTLGDPRVVNLFVVPYQALKGAQGSGDPIRSWASRRSTSWTGAA